MFGIIHRIISDSEIPDAEKTGDHRNNNSGDNRQQQQQQQGRQGELSQQLKAAARNETGTSPSRLLLPVFIEPDDSNPHGRNNDNDNDNDNNCMDLDNDIDQDNSVDSIPTVPLAKFGGKAGSPSSSLTDASGAEQLHLEQQQWLAVMKLQQQHNQEHHQQQTAQLKYKQVQPQQLKQHHVDDTRMEDVVSERMTSNNSATISTQALRSRDKEYDANNKVGTTAGSRRNLERQDSKASDQSATMSTGSAGASREGCGSTSSSGSMKGSNYTNNSSRDWGWFEDVHYGSDQNLSTHQQSSPSNSDTNSDPKRNSTSANGKGKRKSKRPLVPRAVLTSVSRQDDSIIPPRDESAIAAAVTAPTYVLEESLSSQRLWKDTAGCRPPQPVEERAFFEKMWAQNFARSKVNYQMPTEVLTATSPISLSPFSDGLLENDNQINLDNYDVYSSQQQDDDHHRAVLGDSGNNGSGGGGGVGVGVGVIGNPSAEASYDGMMFWNNHHNKNKSSDDSGAWAPYRHQHVVNKTVKDTNDGEYLTVRVRGDNVFGTTVSKSFARTCEPVGSMVGGIDTVNISIASYRVVDSKKHGKYAQFLVIYREGSIRDTVGVWKRYSDFCDLSKKVTQAHEGCANVIANMSPLSGSEDQDIEHLPNAITSWRLLKKRQRWYRCLDAGYLSLKVFLLERFLHDILFESSSPKLLREFVGATGVGASTSSGSFSVSSN